MNEDSNLSKILLHGFAFVLKVDILKKFSKSFRDKFVETIGAMISEMISDKTARFALRALKGFHARIKLSHEETYTLFKSVLSEEKLPDAADLIDDIGMFLSKSGILKFYDNYLFFHRFIDSLHDIGLCDFELGYHSQQRTISVNFRTKGIKEIFDLVMSGFE